MSYFKEKKTYSKPDIEKLPIDENSLDAVTGGISDKGSGKNKDTTAPDTFVNVTSPSSVIDSDIAGEMKKGNNDIQSGRGRGGGCDGVAYHRNVRTFSSGRNSGC